MEDIAVLTGAKFFAADLGAALETATLIDLGSARRVVASVDKTTLVGAGGVREVIAARVKQLKRQISDTESDYDREKLRERLARLAAGVAVIRVGAATEFELKEKKARTDDALHAARAAIAEGILPGGGLALLRAQSVIADLKLSGEEAIGGRIVHQALEAPACQLVFNAGGAGTYVVQQTRLRKGVEGYNVVTGRYENLLSAGVIDPLKVTRSALENAASVAGLLLMTEAVMVDAQDESKPNGGGAAGQ